MEKVPLESGNKEEEVGWTWHLCLVTKLVDDVISTCHM